MLTRFLVRSNLIRSSKKSSIQHLAKSYNLEDMVKFNSIATTAVAAISTTSLAFHSTLHVQAFAPAPKYALNVRHLASSVLDEPVSTAPSDDKLTMGKVVARADPNTFIPSANSNAGIMAIKLIEEDLIIDPLAPVTITEKIEVPKSSESGMFGGSAPKAKSKKPTQGEDFIGKMVQFPGGRKGTIIAQRPPMAFVMCDFGDWDDDAERGHGSIDILQTRTSVPVSDDLFGSIIDCYGNPISQSDASTNTSGNDAIDRAIFAPIPLISEIALINSPLLTGTAMIDALAPIGKGQNMLVVGQDTGVGQRDLVIGAIKTQVEIKGAKCIYAITSQDKNEREQVVQQLKDAGVLDHIVVVSARDHDGDNNDDANDAAEAITVAATACSIGEALALAKGEDTFVVVDDIDQHKAFWDWTTRILVQIWGQDSVVKDDKNGGASSEMRGFYSSLIQRAGKFKEKNGGGSMTLTLLTNQECQSGGNDEEDTVFSPEDFDGSSEKVKERINILVDKKIPLTSDILRKIKIPLPRASDSENKRLLTLQHIDDLISMSDGQIWLDEALYNKGQRPAMDAQRSITRVGIGADTKSRADAPAMRELAGGLRFDFAQADSLDGAGEGSGADKQILKKKAYLLAFHQEGGEERSLSENCVVLIAARSGALDDTIKEGGTAGTELGKEAISKLIEHVRKAAPDALNGIDESLDLNSSIKDELETIVKEYFE